MKIAICDDDLNDLQSLKEMLEYFLKKQRVNAKVDTFTNADNLLAVHKEYSFVILDIIMGKQLGIDVAKKIHYECPSTIIVFYSYNMDYAPETYESYGSGFLVKPLDRQSVFKCLNRVFKKLIKEAIVFKDMDNNVEMNLHINDIDFIESDRKYTIINIKNRQIRCRKLLKEWMEELDGKQFLLCKRGLFVNANFIDSIDSFNRLILNNGRKIKLTEAVGKKFKAELAQYWSDNI